MRDLYGLDDIHKPFSADWYRAFRTAHLKRYPNVDQTTRDNLDLFIEEAEAKEQNR